MQGLTRAEASARLKHDGYNALPGSDKRQFGRIVLDVLREPMLLMLVAAGGIYLLLGDINDALMLLGFVCLVLGMTLFQEYRTEKVLESLRNLTSPRALVVREGAATRIAGREVVFGDLLILNEGDIIPADAIVIECSNLSADESLLSGESAPVDKRACLHEQFHAHTLSPQPPGDNDYTHIYSGTLVVQGRGKAIVYATGSRSEIGKIGKSLKALETENTPLQKEINRLIRWMAMIGAIFCLLLTILYAVNHSSWLQGLLAGITLAMSILPEEYTVVLIFFMAMGAWRISRHHVLARRINTVETLGSATVLCVDKTGTLTQNHMQIQLLGTADSMLEVTDLQNGLPEKYHELLEFAVLSSDTDAFDPMEKAIHALASNFLKDTEHIHQDWIKVHEYALSPQQLALSRVWKAREREEFVVASKGAPEAIADLCHLHADATARLEQQVRLMAERGLRVLGVARALYRGPQWPDIQHDFEFSFVGLIGLADPLRPTVKQAIAECMTAGIRTVMITGDYTATASAIARQIGLPNSETVITGAELDRMDEETLRKRIRECNIFARIVPQQKLRLVNALKDNAEIVAMTGDGVNDAPALKAAHIGIAMGDRGTDVAREAASLVLLHDDFSSIVQAVKLGRIIFDNMRKAMSYIFAVHIPIAGLAMMPAISGWPVLLFPIHIVFLEMIINPACSIVFENEPAESGIMHRPPRNPKEPLFGRKMILASLMQGSLLFLACLAVVYFSFLQGASENTARTLAFATIVTGNLALILVNRSWHESMLATLKRHNIALWAVILGAGIFLGLAIWLPLFHTLFHFTIVTASQLVLCITAGLASVLWIELLKGK